VVSTLVPQEKMKPNNISKKTYNVPSYHIVSHNRFPMNIPMGVLEEDHIVVM
jgi:hypothetical protein